MPGSSVSCDFPAASTFLPIGGQFPQKKCHYPKQPSHRKKLWEIKHHMEKRRRSKRSKAPDKWVKKSSYRWVLQPQLPLPRAKTNLPAEPFPAF